MKDKKHKTSKQDFDYYKERCLYWQKHLSLDTWRLYFEHDADKDILGYCLPIYSNRVATMGFSTEFTEAVTKRAINELALHEILELLLSGLGSLAECRSWDGTEWDKERHTVIRVLEKRLQ